MDTNEPTNQSQIDEGNVYSWGCNRDGQLGQGNISDIGRVDVVSSLVKDRVLKVACGR
jgi:alpha-tubulin suppressor-like RCC1 family protein